MTTSGLALERPLDQARAADTGPSLALPLGLLGILGLYAAGSSAAAAWAAGDWLGAVGLVGGILALVVGAPGWDRLHRLLNVRPGMRVLRRARHGRIGYLRLGSTCDADGSTAGTAQGEPRARSVRDGGCR